MESGAKAEFCSRPLCDCQTEPWGKGWPWLDPQVRGKSTQCILDLVSPNIHSFTGSNSEPQIKSETLYRAGSTTEQVSNISINEQHKRTASISTEKNQKFDK